jgi:hypothetical protein
MVTGMNSSRLRRPIFGLLGFSLFLAGNAFAQPSASDHATTASPELIGQLTQALSITPAQASGGAGALFGLAKNRLGTEDFSKVAASVPGIENLIKSAPAASKNSAATALSGLGHSAPGGLGAASAVAGPFKKLGLSPDMAAKFVPILTQLVGSKGGAGVASLLAGAFK